MGSYPIMLIFINLHNALIWKFSLSERKPCFPFLRLNKSAIALPSYYLLFNSYVDLRISFSTAITTYDDVEQHATVYDCFHIYLVSHHFLVCLAKKISTVISKGKSVELSSHHWSNDYMAMARPVTSYVCLPMSKRQYNYETKLNFNLCCVREQGNREHLYTNRLSAQPYRIETDNTCSYLMTYCLSHRFELSFTNVRASRCNHLDFGAYVRSVIYTSKLC